MYTNMAGSCRQETRKLTTTTKISNGRHVIMKAPVTKSSVLASLSSLAFLCGLGKRVFNVFQIKQ